METPVATPIQIPGDGSAESNYSSSNYSQTPPATLTHNSRLPIPKAAISLAKQHNLEVKTREASRRASLDIDLLQPQIQRRVAHVHQENNRPTQSQWESQDLVFAPSPLGQWNTFSRPAPPDPVPSSESESPHLMKRTDPFGMREGIESDINISNLLKKKKVLRKPHREARDRRRRLYGDFLRAMDQAIRKPPQVGGWNNGNKRYDLEGEEPGALKAYGVVRSWSWVEAVLLWMALAVVTNTLMLCDALRPRVARHAIDEFEWSGIQLLEWEKDQSWVIMNVFTIAGTMWFAKLANSHSRPLTFFLSSLQCIFGLALMVIGQLDDGSFPAGVGFQALGQCGILLIATIITMDTTTALSRGYFLWILSCSSPLWRLLAPALSSPITGLDPRHGWRWVVSVFIVLFTLLVTFINTLLFIFLHRAEEQGFFPPSHQQYQWTPSSIRDLWKNYVMFTAAYDTWGVLLLAISIICVVLGIAFTPPFQQHTSFFTLTPEQQLSMWRWGMVTVGFIGLALFVAWELLISPEFHILDLLHRLLPQKRSSPVIEKPLGTIHVLNTSADALENASATAARYASIIREKKMGRFWHNCKAVISPTLFKTNGALVYLTLGFMTAMLRTLVGQGRAQVEVFWNEHLLSPEMGKWTTLLPIVSIFTETTASLIVVAIIPFYRRLRFIIVLGFALISISTLLLIAPTAPLLTPKHETEHQFITHFLLSSGLGMVEIPLLVSTQTTLSKTRSDATIMTGLLYTVKSFAELLGTTVLENGEWVKEIEKQRVNRRMSELENVKVRAWIQKDERMGASDKFDDFITRPAPNFSDDKINFSEILHPPHPVRWDDFEPLIRFISHLMAIISLVLAITFVSNEDISKPARHSNTDPDNDGIILGIWLAPDEQEAEELVWTEDKHSDGEDWEVIKFDGYNDSEEDED